MIRKKEPTIVCTSCLAQITIRSFCPECGTPTSFATEAERTQYELARWREHANGGSQAHANGSAQAHANGQRPVETAAPPSLLAETPEAPAAAAPVAREETHVVRKEAHVVRKRKLPRAQLLPRTAEPDAVSVSAGTGSDRIEVTYVAPKAPPPKKQPKKQQSRSAVDQATAALEMIGDESIRLVESGRSGFRNATLIITWYRIAVVSGGRTRWMPLEEVQGVALADKVTVHTVIGGESLRFTTSIGMPAEQLAGLIKREVAEARVPNSPRHHPDILQEWCERASARWNSRLRLSLIR